MAYTNSCPVCGSHAGSAMNKRIFDWAPVRTCPDCGNRYTADPASRRRRRRVTTLAVIAFAFTTVGVVLQNVAWSILVILLSIAGLSYIGFAVSQFHYVPYDN